MTISARIVADSISPDLIRIITFELTYPRFIHSEVMTHRVFSRNAASSRAIPILKMLKRILSDMAFPVHWGTNKPGMQADEELSGWRKKAAKALWVTSGVVACGFSYAMYLCGLHKQVANRITEPWQHMTTVITATDWQNFFALRDHEKAQPEFKVLARKMREAMKSSKPKLVEHGEYHLPYVSSADRVEVLDYLRNVKHINPSPERIEEQLIRLSVARCASTSYLTVDGKMMTFERANSLYDKLLADDPIHASPAEHQATPDTSVDSEWDNPKLHGNFTGWIQYRKTLKNEKSPDWWNETSWFTDH